MARVASRRGGVKHVRPSAVSGAFYPEDAGVLRSMVERYLAGAVASAPEGEAVQAVIAPHAGYVYSGPIAGTAFAAVAQRRGSVRRVVNLGPSHYVAFEGVALSGDAAFDTPLGRVRVDRDACDMLLQLPSFAVRDAAHVREHALETHLPFLQVALGEFDYVPMVFGDVDPGDIAAALARLWDDRTLIVVSSDLSHYHEYDDARRLDRAVADAIERLDPHAIGFEQACGRLGIQALLQWAEKSGWRALTLDLRNSGDTAGASDPGRDRVVGYGAFIFV
jgi:AmmeMemoRadiSam system protein B